MPPANESSDVLAQTFQIGALPQLNTLLFKNSPGQLAADRLFLALARGDDPASDAQDDFWNTSVWHEDGKSGPSPDSGAVSAAGSDEQQAPERMAMDTVFAQMD